MHDQYSTLGSDSRQWNGVNQGTNIYYFIIMCCVHIFCHHLLEYMTIDKTVSVTSDETTRLCAHAHLYVKTIPSTKVQRHIQLIPSTKV